MNKLYVFQVGKKFVKVNDMLSCRLTGKIENASYWSSQSNIVTWRQVVIKKYPKAEIKEATLKLI